MAMMSSFWGVEVKAGKTVAVEPSPDEAYHLTQVALGKGHKPGSATAVQLEVASEDLATRKFVIGTLVSGSVNQFTAEMLFQEPFQLSHTGTGSVFVMGFKQEDLYNDLVKAYDEWDGSGSSDEEGGAYSSDEEEEDPSLDELDEEELKRKIGKKLVAKRQQPGGGAKPEMDSSDDEDYDDMEEDTSDSDDGPDAVLDFEDDDLDEDGSSLEDDEDSSSSDDDDEPGAGSEDSEDYSEDEEKLVKGDKKKVSKIPVVKQGSKKKGQAAPADESSDSYSSDDDSSGSGDDGSDSSSEEEEEAPPKAKGKRAAPATPAGPGKKSKTGGTPPSRQEGPKTPQTDAEYEKHLISYLRKHGAQDMSALGLAIKRPPRVAKLSMFLKERGDVFVRDGNKVSLK